MMKHLNLKITGLVCLVALSLTLAVHSPGVHSGFYFGRDSLSEGARVVRGDMDLFLRLKETTTIGERIGIVRRYRGVTQRELADRLGVSIEAIAQYENDYRNISPLHLCQLASLLNIDVWYLLMGLPKAEALKELNLYSNIPLIELALWEEERLIGERIKLARLALGLKQQELAEKLGIPPNYINAWERGRRFIPLDKIEVLSSILEIDLELFHKANISPEMRMKIEEIKPVSFIGERIREKREKLGWSQQYLSNLIKVSRVAVSQWETGLFDISTQYIPKLAKVLEMDVWMLVAGKTKEEALERENILPLIPPFELIRWGNRRIIGERLRLSRLANGWTLEELSERIRKEGINIAPTTLSNYEAGVFPLPEEIIPILARLLDLEIFQLEL